MVALAVLGAVVVPAFGVLAVFNSDGCGSDSGAYYCGGDGQMTGVVVGLAAGLGALVAGVVVSAVSRRGSKPWRWWPAYVLAVQVAGFLVIRYISSLVS